MISFRVAIGKRNVNNLLILLSFNDRLFILFVTYQSSDAVLDSIVAISCYSTPLSIGLSWLLF